MKTAIILIVAAVCFAAQAFAESATARLDGECHFHSGTFTVPAGKSATNLRMDLDSSWLPCTAPGKVTRIGGRLIGPTGGVLFYRVQYSEGKSEILAGNLTGLALGQGTYTVEVRDGGKGTNATVSYDLIDSAAPPAASTVTTSAGPGGWGSIGGDWTDPTVKSSARIVQSGGTVTITNSFVWEGKTVTWTGTGTVSGNDVSLNYRYTGYKPEGWEDGSMKLTRTNSKTLSGSWTTVSGKYSQPITFIQTRSDNPQPAIPAASKPAATKPAATTAAPPPISKPQAAPAKTACPPGYIYAGPGRCEQIRREVEER